MPPGWFGSQLLQKLLSEVHNQENRLLKKMNKIKENKEQLLMLLLACMVAMPFDRFVGETSSKARKYNPNRLLVGASRWCYT